MFGNVKNCLAKNVWQCKKLFGKKMFGNVKNCNCLATEMFGNVKKCLAKNAWQCKKLLDKKCLAM